MTFNINIGDNMDKLIKRFFLNRRTQGELFTHHLSTVPKTVMEYFKWDESTPMKMSYTDKGIVIEKEEKGE